MADEEREGFAKVELMVRVDECGDYEIGKDGDELSERWEESIGESDNGTAYRTVSVVMWVPLPKPVQVVVEVPAEGGEVTVKVA